MKAVCRILCAAFCLLAVTPASAEPTEVMVRVLSMGGKFVGSSMGGAEIILRDVQSGEILARGVTSGSTGDTRKIMAGGPRGTALADDQTAGFRATIELDQPRLVEVSAYGPLAQPQAALRVTAQQWLVPGRHLTAGDGWVLEMPGLVVDVVQPAAHKRLDKDANSLMLTTNVALMCGCPIEPGGIWDASRFDVRAHVRHNGMAIGDFPLSYAGETGRFAVTLPLAGKGEYVVSLSAMDQKTGATGVDYTTFILP